MKSSNAAEALRFSPAGEPIGASHQRWQRVRRVLAVRLDNLGDVLMTTPALAAIRESLPGVHLTLLASGSGAAVAPFVPVIDDTISFDAPWTQRPRPLASDAAVPTGRAEHRLVQRLAEGRFDAAVIFTVCTQSALPAALICRMAGIPLRLAHCRENPYELLTDWVPEADVVADGMRHEVARQLALVASVGFEATSDKLRFRYATDDVARASDRLRSAGVAADSPYFLVHVGATAPSRRYPAEHFGAAADLIARQSGCVPVFTGSAGEGALIDEARSGMRQPSVSLAGQLELGSLAATIAGAQLLVANNTGPVHMAAAVGTPVVDLYALTNPQHTPWRVRSRVLNHMVACRNCLKSVCPEGHHDCLRQVTPESVASASLALMGPGPGISVRRRFPSGLSAGAPLPNRPGDNAHLSAETHP